jgi:hypothetical protein
MSTSQTSTSKIVVGSPEDLLPTVPRLLGFRPSLSFVILALGSSNEVVVTLRYDLPDPADHDIAGDIARHAVAVLSAQAIETAVAVGYGPGELVTPVADAFRDRSAAREIRVKDCLRAEDHRYWSYVCGDPEHCPPEGRPYSPDPGPDGEAATTGEPVLVSREELAETLAPVTGEDAESMLTATRRAEERAARMSRQGRKANPRRPIITSGLQAVADAIRTYQDGGRFTGHDEPARLSVALRSMWVRDDAWARMDPGHKREHARLWTDMTRLARPGYVAPAASLLAFVCWQAGNGAVANIALDRALSDDPQYRMAQLLRQAIDFGAPPSLAQIPMSPEDVAAAYEGLEAEGSASEDGPGSTAEKTMS